MENNKKTLQIRIDRAKLIKPNQQKEVNGKSLKNNILTTTLNKHL